MLKHNRIAAFSLALWTSAAAFAFAQGVEADLVLRGGSIYDGTGAASVRGDVALKEDRIVGVGQFELKLAVPELDCTGLMICPGFIDLHNHSDSQIVDRLTRANLNFLTQGCTTIVTGNCGSGPVEVREFYDKIDSAGAGTNVAHLLPQGSLRGFVIGRDQREATADELARMQELTDKAMREGAWGMSTGLIYVPSSYASTDELAALAAVVAKHGGMYASHIRNENSELLVAVEEALTIGRRAGLPIHISHFKSSGRNAWGLVRQAADLIEKARQAGEKVTADQYPYIASSTSLDATLLPTWALAGDRQALLARLDDAEQGSRIRDAITESLHQRNDGAALRIARYAPRQDWVGKSLAEIAAAENVEPLEVALQITRAGGAAIVNFSMNEEDVRHVMQLPWVATASDGRAYLPGADRPHPRSYGTFSRKIGMYAMRENVLPLEQAIRSSSGLPAEILGLTDRGQLKAGHYADVVVLDPAEYLDTATFESPHNYSAGVRYVFVNGQPAVFDGHPTGALAGKALRRLPPK